MDRMPVIYVAGPYSASTQQEIDKNIERASGWSQLIWAVGGVAICPHLNTMGFESDGSMEPGSPEWREDFSKFLAGDFEIISRCDAVFFVNDWDLSKGAVAEYAFASYMGIPCLFERSELLNFIDEY